MKVWQAPELISPSVHFRRQLVILFGVQDCVSPRHIVSSSGVVLGCLLYSFVNSSRSMGSKLRQFITKFRIIGLPDCIIVSGASFCQLLCYCPKNRSAHSDFSTRRKHGTAVEHGHQAALTTRSHPLTTSTTSHQDFPVPKTRGLCISCRPTAPRQRTRDQDGSSPSPPPTV